MATSPITVLNSSSHLSCSLLLTFYTYLVKCPFLHHTEQNQNSDTFSMVQFLRFKPSQITPSLRQLGLQRQRSWFRRPLVFITLDFTGLAHLSELACPRSLSDVAVKLEVHGCFPISTDSESATFSLAIREHTNTNEANITHSIPTDRCQRGGIYI
jgi:hypothetical protein